MKKRIQRFGLILLILSLVLSGNFGNVAVQAAGVSVRQEADGDFSGEEEPPELYDSISLLRIEDYSNASLTLSWFSDGNNEGFIIYRKCKYDQDYKQLGTVQNIPYATHYFKDGSFQPGIKFTYKIVAYRTDDEGNIIEGQEVTESVSVTIPKTSISSVSRSGQKITVKWKKLSGISGYEIFCKTGSGSYQKKASVSSTNIVKWVFDNLSSTKTVKFKVRPYVKYGDNYIYGSYSGVKSVYSAAVQKVINKFKKLQKRYPNGKYWNHVNRARYDSTTVTNKPCTHITIDDISTCNHYNCPNGILGYQCYGFAWKMSDLIYGRSAKIKNFKSFSKCKMGDVIRYKGHSVIITEKHKDYVVVGECNYGNTCMILWGRKVHKSELTKATYSRRYR